MLQLLLAASRLLVVHSAAGFVYALPALFLLGAVAAAAAANWHWQILGVLTGAFLAANTLYIYAATKHILKNPERVDFLEMMRWRKQHTDFLLWVAAEMLVLVFLALYFADSFVLLRALADELGAQKNPEYQVGFNAVLLFGSQVAAALFLFIALALWMYLCRAGIRIPAHADGNFLRASEALALTRGNTIKIAALSLLFIAAVSSVATTIAAVPVFGAAAYPFILPAAYFAVMQPHLAMWAALYKIITKNYTMTKVVF